jgi:voltage-gated potassium channel
MKLKIKKQINALIIKELLFPIAALAMIILIGFLGFMLIEGFSPLKSLYVLVITLATIGYGDVVPITNAGRIFTILLVISAFTVGVYAISKISAFLLEGEFSTLLKQRKMNKTLDAMSDHYIVCGYGKTGKRVMEDLLDKGFDVVLIETDKDRNEKVKEIYGRNFVHLDADATEDAVLIQAGVKRARMLISVLSTDAENLFVTLSAKDLNKDIKVITRVAEGNSPEKFKKAGADFIVSPIEIATDRIISIATTSSEFFSFVDFAGGKHELRDYIFGLVEIHQGSDLIGKTYREANIPQRTNLVVIGYNSMTSEFQINPKADDLIRLGDRLLVFGQENEINGLKKIAMNLR